MYTFKVVYYGIDLKKEIEGIMDLEDKGVPIEEIFEYSGKYDDYVFEMGTGYHGSASESPISFGINITDTDDDGGMFIYDVRNAHENNLREAYNKALGDVINIIEENKNDFEQMEEDDGVPELLAQLMETIKNKEPYFYSVEYSS